MKNNSRLFSGYGSALLQLLKENLAIAPMVCIAALVYAIVFAFILPVEGVSDGEYIHYSGMLFIQFLLQVLVIFNLILGVRALEIRSQWKRNILFLAAFMVGAIATTLLTEQVDYALRDHSHMEGNPQQRIKNIAATLFFIIPVYVIYLRKDRTEADLKKQEMALLKAEQEKASADLEALQSKINPQFLRHSLACIEELIGDRPQKAVELVISLSEFLRYSINTYNETYAPLKKEVAIVKHYLSIEQVRSANAFMLKLEISPEVENRVVPRMLLLSLVEIALKYALDTTGEQKVLVIRAEDQQDQLQIAVIDNGPAFPEDFTDGNALKNIYNKLDFLKPGEYSVLINGGPLKSVIINLRNSDTSWKSFPTKPSLLKMNERPEIV